MTNVITYCLAASGISNVLMSPLDNKTSYSDILVPPLTTLGNLIYLEQQYGFYTAGALIFFDVDCNYILSATSKCTAWRNQEYKQTVFTVRDSTNADVFTPGSFVDDTEKRYYINITPKSINMNSDSVIADQIDGNNLIIIHPSSGNISTKKSKTTQRGEGTYKLLINKYNNDFCNNTALYKKGEASNILSATINDFDIDALSPNKEFQFVFENSQINNAYSGNYRICKCTFVFSKQGTDFMLLADTEFKKYDT
jgi:hypothetical protein